MRTSSSSVTLAAVVFAIVAAPGCQRTSASAPATETATVVPLVPRIPQELPFGIDPLPAPAIALTASDGTGLRLVSLTARAVAVDPLAFTELHLAFENPLDRVLEGTFRITLTDGASLGRFAMKIGDDWQEGEVVEKARAREAYEDFLHRKQDPALLEQAAGNEFSARVFPIPAHGVKELVLAYSQELGARRPYALPLRGLPALDSLDVSLSLGDGTPPQEMKLTKSAPTADFVIDPKRVTAGDGLRSGNLVVVRVHPDVPRTPEAIASAIVLVDTSASRALGFEEELTTLERVVHAIVESSGANAKLAVAAFDQTVSPVFDGEAGSFGTAEIERIRERRALGASNVEQAIAWARDRSKKGPMTRVIALTDGVATAGATEPSALVAAVKQLRDGGAERFDAIAIGGIRDEALLRQMVTAGLPHDGTVVDAQREGNAIARRLTQATQSGIEVRVAESSWSWPRTLDGVQAGDEALVYAEVPPETAVKISLGASPAFSPTLTPVERPLVERAWAQAKIASYMHRQAREGDSAEMRGEVIALSTHHRVLSPYTALLVLETERDYARFKIDRRALASILTVQDGRLAMRSRPFEKAPATATASPSASQAATADAKNRARSEAREFGLIGQISDTSAEPSSDPALTAPPVFAADPLSARGNAWGDAIGDSFGAGGLGLSGAGEGGGGRGEGIGLGSVGSVGHGSSSGGVAGDVRQGSLGGIGSGNGRLGGAHATRAPTIRQGATQVSGRLPPEVIQRIVRQNFGRFRLCYERGLATTLSLQGRVAVRFVIGPNGAVARATDGGSDLPSPQVIACIVQAFTSLSFPMPEGGGEVTVTYPIVFAPGDDSAPNANDPLAAPDTPQAPPVEKPAASDPYTGTFKTVMQSIARGDRNGALARAKTWQSESPGDVMALVALGSAFEATSDASSAARAYGSIVDLFPARADLRRFAGVRLEHLHGNDALALAIDTFAKAEKNRPDHPSSHRLFAFALLKNGEPAKAFDAALAGVKQAYPEGRFRGVDRILREDLGLIAAAWIKAEPSRRSAILARLAEVGVALEDAPSVRFVLSWETDANDVDFHIYDDRGGHAFFSRPDLPSGGSLYADVTTGYGPECFTIRGPKKGATYTLQANYYSRGPMGYGMGKVEIVDHDGKGGLTFDERPFVTMVDHSFVDLGTLKR